MSVKNLQCIYKIGIQFLFSILFSYTSLAQLQEVEISKNIWTTVGELKWLGKTKASLKYFVNKADTSYLLYLQDEEKLKDSRDKVLTKYFSIRFQAKDNTVDKLYNLLISFFYPENRKNKKLEKIFNLGNEMVQVQHYSKITGSAIMFSTKENHILFTEKELKKLFDR